MTMTGAAHAATATWEKEEKHVQKVGLCVCADAGFSLSGARSSFMVNHLKRALGMAVWA